MSLTLQLFKKNLKIREFKIILLVLSLSIASVFLMNLLGQTCALALKDKTSGLIGGDIALSSPHPIPASLQAAAQAQGLLVSSVIDFSTMAVKNESMVLTEVRAVDKAYPLTGKIVRAKPDGLAQPAPGTVWADAQLLDHGFRVDEPLSLGAGSLILRGLISSEPGRSTNLINFGPKLLINLEDIDALQVLHPASRASYGLMLKGTDPQLNSFRHQYKKTLDPSIKWTEALDAQGSVRDMVERASRYLKLISLGNLCLAAICLWNAGVSFQRTQTPTVALLRSLGLSRRALGRLYISQLLGLSLLASLIGAGLGWLGISSLLIVLKAILAEVRIPPLGPALVIAWLMGLSLLLSFVYPALWRLQRTSPAQILRAGEITSVRPYGLQTVCGILLLAFFFQQVPSLALLSMSLTVLFALYIVVAASLRLLKYLSAQMPTNLARRLVLAQLFEDRKALSLQITALALSIALIAVVSCFKTGLIHDWQAKLKPYAPNYFVINVEADKLMAFESRLTALAYEAPKMYPIIRAQLQAINQRTLAQIFTDDDKPKGLYRPVNLSQVTSLPQDAELVAGEPWANETDALQVSVEKTIADRLNLKVGDWLTFNINSEQVDVKIQNIRKVDWDSLQPNFYFLFKTPTLESYPLSYMTSCYIHPQLQNKLVDLVKEFPDISLISIQSLLNQIEHLLKTLCSLSQIVWLYTFALVAVLFTALSLIALPRRARAQALLQALGLPPRYLSKLILVEYAIMGASAAGLGLSLARAVLYILARKAQLNINFDYRLAAIISINSVVLCMAVAYISSRQMFQTSPNSRLRVL